MLWTKIKQWRGVENSPIGNGLKIVLSLSRETLDRDDKGSSYVQGMTVATFTHVKLK